VPVDQTRILVIEDNPGDALLLETAIREAGDSYQLDWEKNLGDGLDRLGAETFDVLLLDLGLPDCNGIDTFIRALQHSPDVPIIVFSGMDDEQLAAEAVSRGAQDYMVKGTVDARLLTRSIRYAIERKRSEQALKCINAELEGYASTVSHDLRSPIGAMALACELLADTEGLSIEELRVEVAESTASIRRNLQKCSTLIDDILALARAGQRPAEIADVDLSQTVKHVLEEKTAGIRDRGVDVSVDEDLGVVHGSPTHMYQLFLNLISNALEHNDSAEPRIDVRRLSDTPGGALKFMVRDNGSGIPPESIQDFLMPFVAGKKGGTGIGLSIVKKIVELYGGELKIYSGDGATIEFTLQNMPD